MWSQVARWLDNSNLPDPIQRRQAPLVQIMLVSMIVLAASVLPVFALTPWPQPARAVSVFSAVMVLAAASAALVTLRHGRFNMTVGIAGAGTTIALMLGLVATGLPCNGNILFLCALPITLAGLSAQRRMLVAIAAATAAMVLLIGAVETVRPDLAGFQPVGPELGPPIAIGFVLGLIVLCLFLDRFSSTLRNALTELSDANVRLQVELNERRAVEAALRESEARYRRLAENAPDMIFRFRLRPTPGYEYVSPAASRMFGYTLQEYYNDPLMWRRLVPPEELDHIDRLFSSTVPAWTQPTVVRALNRAGETVWCEIHQTPIYGPDGDIVAVEGIVRDVTERKQLEAQLFQLQKLESIGQLAGGVAHDFNNLLVVITGSAEMAREVLPPDSPAQADIDDVLRAAWRAAELTRQLLAFARRQSGYPQVLNLNDLIGAMDRMMRRLIGEDVELVTATEPKLWPVRADASQIEQVIANLTVNARDAMPNGGRLTIETSNVVLDPTYAQQHLSVEPGPYVLLAISDNGIGMTEEVRQRAFEPFFTTKEPGRGTGLGLATTYGIVRQSGGHIWIYSELGHGTTVKVYLPRAEDVYAAAAEQRDNADAPTGDETILLVEDDAAVRTLAARVLRAQGYQVIEATDAAQALALAGEQPHFDLLLTDVVMPRTSGPELAAMFSSRYPGIRVLYTSGYTDRGAVRAGQIEASAAFLQKPFTPAALAQKVREVLDAAA
jgi:PAS domain S-box-containing protein